MNGSLDFLTSVLVYKFIVRLYCFYSFIRMKHANSLTNEEATLAQDKYHDRLMLQLECLGHWFSKLCPEAGYLVRNANSLRLSSASVA